MGIQMPRMERLGRGGRWLRCGDVVGDEAVSGEMGMLGEAKLGARCLRVEFVLREKVGDKIFGKAHF
jgi:hypothetical protein